MKSINSLICVIPFFIFCCESVSGEPENKLDTLVPRYREATTAREDNFGHILNRLGIKEKPKIEEVKGNKLVKIKFRVFDVELKESIRDSKASGLNIHFFYPAAKKGKRYWSRFSNGSYGESNYCYASSTLYAKDAKPDPVRWDYYDCGRSLSVNNDRKYIDEKCWDTNDYVNDSCREFATVDFNGKEWKRMKPDLDPSSCPHKCYDLIPYMDTGEYVVRKAGVLVRDIPSRKGKIITKLEKDANVIVTEDTGKIEEIEENIAPWVKVKLGDGKEGYVFGIFLKRPGEFWP
ncbi:SH3 domain-containing protein [Leptospira sp. 'Mane']|uniref:SH3 domain-containing protein n=1 Tax=Leptospira sp. 'Mane' TaxID=3387407 RepID=UPI00398B6D82